MARIARRPSHRPERVGELVRELITGFLTEQVRDPRIGFVTVTGVDVTPDLGHARVRVTVMGAPEERARTLEGLESAASFLRTRLARELHLRTSPDLSFELDRGLAHATRIEQVLRELKEGAG